ncbi:hypothetical protein [Caballeronia sp. LZ043]|nr:hypothetical protein [Caballeronia sp. LZ043]MDR5825849.1 hypothetical protein [Caballeronia sp. LZ043]
MKSWQMFLVLSVAMIAPHLPLNFAIGACVWWVILTLWYAGKDR